MGKSRHCAAKSGYSKQKSEYRQERRGKPEVCFTGFMKADAQVRITALNCPEWGAAGRYY